MLNSSRQKEVVKIESSQCLLLEVDEFDKARQILGNRQHLHPDEQFLLEDQQVEPQAEALQEEAEGEQGGQEEGEGGGGGGQGYGRWQEEEEGGGEGGEEEVEHHGAPAYWTLCTLSSSEGRLTVLTKGGWKTTCRRNKLFAEKTEEQNI